MKCGHSMFHSYSIAISGGLSLKVYIVKKNIFSNTASVLANSSFSIYPNDQIKSSFKRHIYIYIVGFAI